MHDSMKRFQETRAAQLMAMYGQVPEAGSEHIEKSGGAEIVAEATPDANVQKSEALSILESIATGTPFEKSEDGTGYNQKEETEESKKTAPETGKDKEGADENDMDDDDKEPDEKKKADKKIKKGIENL